MGEKDKGDQQVSEYENVGEDGILYLGHLASLKSLSPLKTGQLLREEIQFLFHSFSMELPVHSQNTLPLL